MFIIGNIVVKGNSKISIPRLNVVSDISEVNNPYPTLMVGYYDLKEKYTLDFLNRKLDDDLFWTFKRDEERTMYNKDLYDFVIYCEEKFLAEFNYHPIDPFRIKRGRLKRIIRAVKRWPTVFNVDKDMLFIHVRNVTFGFNMAMGEVIGMDRTKLLNKFKALPNVTELGEERINKITLSMGDIEFDTAQLPYLSEKILE